MINKLPVQLQTETASHSGSRKINKPEHILLFLFVLLEIQRRAGKLGRQ